MSSYAIIYDCYSFIPARFAGNDPFLWEPHANLIAQSTLDAGNHTSTSATIIFRSATKHVATTRCSPHTALSNMLICWKLKGKPWLDCLQAREPATQLAHQYLHVSTIKLPWAKPVSERAWTSSCQRRVAIRFGALGRMESSRGTDPTCDQWRWLSNKQYIEVVRALHHALDVAIQTLGIPLGPLQVAQVPLELGQTQQMFLVAARPVWIHRWSFE